jgi:hypothetical protein
VDAERYGIFGAKVREPVRDFVPVPEFDAVTRCQRLSRGGVGGCGGEDAARVSVVGETAQELAHVLDAYFVLLACVPLALHEYGAGAVVRANVDASIARPSYDFDTLVSGCAHVVSNVMLKGCGAEFSKASVVARRSKLQDAPTTRVLDLPRDHYHGHGCCQYRADQSRIGVADYAC